MKFIFMLTLLVIIFYTIFSTYLLYLESQRRTLIRKILVAGAVGIALSLSVEVFGEIEILPESFAYLPVIVFVALISISVVFINFPSRNQKSEIQEKPEVQNAQAEKKPSGVIANWAESVLSIVEDRREKRERRGNDRRKDGSFIRLESGDPHETGYSAPTLEVSWHGVFSENIPELLKQNILIPRNIHSEFYIYIYKIKSRDVLQFRLPKPVFSFLPVVSLDFSGIQFDPGDRILICTKNLITNPNKNGAMFGEEKIKSFLKENFQLNSKEFAGRFAEDLQDWAEDLKKEGKAAFSAIEII